MKTICRKIFDFGICILLAFTISVISSCENSSSGGGGGGSSAPSRAGLSIKLPTVENRATEYTKSDTVSFEVSIYSPKHTETKKGKPGDTIEFVEIPVGDYTVIVEGLNDSGQKVSRAVSTATVTAGTSTAVPMKLSVLEYYNVSFEPNEGEGNIVSLKATVGEDFIMPENTFTPPAGKKFRGWVTKDETGANGDLIEAGKEFLLTDDTVFYAMWISENDFDISYENYDSETDSLADGSNILPISYSTGDSVLIPALADRIGYAFGGWFADEDFEEELSSWNAGEKTGDIVLYAKWNRMTVSSLEEIPESGTYFVDDADDLLIISAWSNNDGATFENVTFILCDDITIESGWTPISHKNGGFYGTFDGNGHTLSVPLVVATRTNPNFDEPTGTALVGDNYGTIKNLIYYIEGKSESDTAYISATLGNSNVWNGDVAPFAGRNFGTIQKCWNRANIETPYLRLGGIAGWNYGTIEDCMNTGNLRVYNAAANSPRVGGIAGALSVKYEGKIKNCVNYGTAGLKSGYSQSNVKSVPGAICGDVYGDENASNKTQIIQNCFFIDTSVVLNNFTYILCPTDVYPNTDNERPTRLASYLSVSGCGIFNSSYYNISAGTAANCISDQTLAGSTLIDNLSSNWVLEDSGRAVLNFE